MTKLFDFLTDIATNPKQQIALAQKPRAVMVAAGLSASEQELIESKSSRKIAASFADEYTPLAVVCADPGSDPLPDPDPPDDPDSSEED